MRRKFLENLIFLLFLNLLIKPFWILGVDRQVQNIVGAQDYGFYFSIFNFSYLFFIFLDLGITNFNNRNIARNAHLLSQHFGGIATLKLLLGLAYGILIFFVGWLVGYNQQQIYLLAWVGFNMFLLSFILYLRSNISGLLLFKTDSVLSVLDRILMIVLVGVLLIVPAFKKSFTIEWFVYAQTVAYGITAVTAFVIVLGHTKKLNLIWDYRFYSSILKQSFPFALLVLIMGFYSRVDGVLIERLLPNPLGQQQAGVYAQAYRLLDAGQNISYLFAVLLLPLFSKMLKEQKPVSDLVKLSFSILITGSLIVAITAQFFSVDLMHLMYIRHTGETITEYQLRMQESGFIFQMLMLGLVAVSSNYIFGTLLTANNNLKILNIIAFSGLLINLILNFVLIPVMQARGAAIATLGTQFLTGILQLFIAVRYIHLKIERRLFIRMIIFMVALLVMGIATVHLSHFNWAVNWILLVIVGILFAFLFKLLNVRSFFRVLKERSDL